jgi:hypothetical protein
VLSSGSQILEQALLASDESTTTKDNSSSLALSRAALTAGAVLTCFGLSQIGGFGVVANLVGGVVSSAGLLSRSSTSLRMCFLQRGLHLYIGAGHFGFHSTTSDGSCTFQTKNRWI